MANHCVYEECFECKNEWCLRGCGYDWCRDSGCGKYAKDPKEIEREKKALEELERNLPEGWF